MKLYHMTATLPNRPDTKPLLYPLHPAFVFPVLLLNIFFPWESSNFYQYGTFINAKFLYPSEFWYTDSKVLVVPGPPKTCRPRLGSLHFNRPSQVLLSHSKHWGCWCRQAVRHRGEGQYITRGRVLSSASHYRDRTTEIPVGDIVISFSIISLSREVSGKLS